MVVDDDDDIRHLLVRFLDRRGSPVQRPGMGYHCIEAASGPEALALYYKHQGSRDLPKIGLILMDWLLPGVTGLSVTKEIASLGDSPPIVFVTAKGTAEDHAAMRATGAAGFITKPFTRHEILETVARYWPTDDLKD